MIDGPIFDISILININSKYYLQNNNVVNNDISIKYKIDFLYNIINKLKNEFDEIKIKVEENKDKILNEIKMFWEKPLEISRNLNIECSLNLGYNRDSIILLTTSDDEKLMVDIQCLEDDDNPCRDEAMKLLNKMMEILHGYCGTIGVEGDALDIGFDEEELIEKIIWNEANK